MTVTYWTNFPKKKNSTKIATSGTDVVVVLKDDCSKLNPTLKLTGVPINANYFYISEWGRYYFVDNAIYLNNDIIQFNLEVDTLASFKTDIGNTVAHIAYAATGWDKDIVDSRTAIKSSKVKYQKTAATELDATGCYIITVFNNANTSSNGMATSYAMNTANMALFKQFLGDDTVYAALKSYFVGDPINSVFGAIWVPFPLSTVPGSAVSTLHIGNDSTTAHGYSITAYELSGTGIYSATELQVEIPFKYNDFRDISPYSTGQIYLPGAGKADLNLGDWLDTVNMKIEYTMEYGTGDLTYYLKDVNGYLIQTVSCNVASQCPLGQVTNNGSGILTSTGATAASLGGLAFGAVTGNAAAAGAGALGLLTGAASIAASANTHAASLKGNSGGRTSTEIRDVIITVFDADTEDVDNVNYIARCGRPVGVTHAINNHSGYVQCENASCDCAGTAIEKDRINAYLNSGFYYE